MKKIFTIVLLLVCFTACKIPMKVADSTQTEIQDNSKLDVEQSHVAQQQSAGTVTITVAEDETIVEEATTVNYDTSQPVDSTTGRPPIQSETTTRKTTTKGKQTQAEEVNNTTATVQDSLRDKSQLDQEHITQTDHEETPKYNTLKYIFYILLTALIGTAGWLAVRKFKVF